MILLTMTGGKRTRFSLKRNIKLIESVESGTVKPQFKVDFGDRPKLTLYDCDSTYLTKLANSRFATVALHI